jgi:hypothetical protein
MSTTTFEFVGPQPNARRSRPVLWVLLVVFVLITVRIAIFIEGLWDDVGIIKRLTMSPAEIAEMQADRVMLTQVHFFHQVYDLSGIHYDYTVGCPIASMSTADRARWVSFAARHGWGPYPAAGDLCVDP